MSIVARDGVVYEIHMEQFSIYEGESSENIKYFYLVIYWTQKVQNDIILLRSLDRDAYKFSSYSEVHGYF